MLTVVVIPARLASTRLPGKPLMDLGGVPLVVRTARQAQRCGSVDRVLIATDAPEVLQVAEAHGIEARMSSAEHPSGTDRVAEVASGLGAEVIINLQADEPFTHPDDLGALAAKLTDSKTDMATLRVEIDDPASFNDPHVVKVVAADDGTALYFSRAPIPYPREPDRQPGKRYRHLGIYAYRTSVLQRLAAAPEHPLEATESLEQLRALALGIKIAVVSARSRGCGIDTHADLLQARALVDALGEAAFPGSLSREEEQAQA